MGAVTVNALCLTHRARLRRYLARLTCHRVRPRFALGWILLLSSIMLASPEEAASEDVITKCRELQAAVRAQDAEIAVLRARAAESHGQPGHSREQQDVTCVAVRAHVCKLHGRDPN
jgi:hypothetical protein